MKIKIKAFFLVALICFLITGCTTSDQQITNQDVSNENITSKYTSSEFLSSKEQVSKEISSLNEESKVTSVVSSENPAISNSQATESKEESKNKEMEINIDVKGKKLVAFTFDDGPNEYSKALYETFWKNGGHCTFFVVGNKVNGNYSNLLKAFVKNGNQIGNHSYSHERMTSLLSADILEDFTKCQNAVKTFVGYEMTMARLPHLAGDFKVYSVMKQLNLSCIAGIDTSASSVGSLQDYVPSFTADKIETAVLETIYDGAIFLCHSTDRTSDAMEQVLPKLKDQGYAFVTVEEMMYLKGHTPIPVGCQIVDGNLKIR